VVTVEAGTSVSSGRERIVHRAINPLLATLPERFDTFRKEQVRAVDEVIRGYDRGAKVVVLDAPTGSGKTLIGETVRRMAGARSAIYVCSDKQLQAQFAREFRYSRVLMGRANYPTVHFAENFRPGDIGSVSCDDCTKTEKSPCSLCPDKHECPYEMAKRAALASFLPVVNTAYALTEWNGPGRFSGRPFIIVDEADLLEGALMNHVSVDVSRRRMDRYGWDAPKLTVEADWRRWCDEKADETQRMMWPLLRRKLDIRQAKELRYLRGLNENLSRIVRDIDSGESSWVYDGDRERVSFKPAKVRGYGKEMLWRHGKRWLLMSASIGSSDELMWSLGMDGDYQTVRLGSSFPIRNRLVKVRAVGDMTRKAGGRNDGAMVAATRRIVAAHPGDRVIVHTVSYDRALRVSGALRAVLPDRKVIGYTTSLSRDSALALYKATEGSVLVGPSLDRGIDLPGDLCRVQVILKVPFPNKGDKVVNARYYSGREGKTWYTLNTVRTLVQMTGRAVRSDTDWAVTYILDSAFGDILWCNGGRSMFPQWWKDALVWEREGRDERRV